MIRLAIIGLGAVTRNIHLPAYARLKNGVQVVAGCDPDETARRLVQSKWRLPAVYAGAEEMIRKERPDAVAICTPPWLHREQTVMALEAGCHVFCEKPLADDLAQADEMIEASERAKRIVVVNSQFPCMQIHRAAKAMIGAREFGRLLFLHARQKMRPTEKTEAGWRGQMERRVCFEFGVHVFELVRFFFDATPQKIFAHMPRPNPELKFDAINTIAMEFADGRAATIVLDRLHQGADSYLEIDLDGEFASIHTAIGSDARLELGLDARRRRPFFNLHLVKGGKAVLENSAGSRLIAKDGLNPFAAATAFHFNRFIRAIEQGSIPPGTANDHRRTLALALAAYDSARSGRAMELDSYLGPVLSADR